MREGDTLARATHFQREQKLFWFLRENMGLTLLWRCYAHKVTSLSFADCHQRQVLLIKCANCVFLQFVPSHIINVKVFSIASNYSLFTVLNEIGRINWEVGQKYTLDFLWFRRAFHVIISAFWLQDTLRVWNIKQFHFSIQTTRHQNIFARVEVDRWHHWLMLVTKVCIDQLLKLEFSWFENGLILLKYRGVRLQ